MTGKKTNTVTLVGIIALGIAVAVPFFVRGDYAVGILIMTLINIIVTLGLNFITGLVGQMNLGTAGIYALGAYTTALMTTKMGMNPWLTLIFSVLMGLAIGQGLGYPSLRVKGIFLALTTIAFNEIVRIMLSNLELTNGIRGVHGIPAFSLFGFSFARPIPKYYLFLAIAVVMIIIAYRITNSKWGRLFKAIRDNEEAVEGSGVDVAPPKILAFTLAAIYGCIGGSLYAIHMGFIAPTTFTFDLSTTFVIMMILGGIGSVPGCVLGGVIVTILPEMLRGLGEWYWIIFSFIVLLFVLFKPYGIISMIDHMIHKDEDEVAGSGNKG